LAATKKKRVVIAGVVAVACGISGALLVLRWIPHEVSRERFLMEVRQRQLKKVTIHPGDHGSVAVADYGNPSAIRTVLAEDDQSFTTELRALGVEVTFDTSDGLSP
jgi:hypothetical protein